MVGKDGVVTAALHKTDRAVYVSRMQALSDDLRFLNDGLESLYNDLNDDCATTVSYEILAAGTWLALADRAMQRAAFELGRS